MATFATFQNGVIFSNRFSQKNISYVFLRSFFVLSFIKPGSKFDWILVRAQLKYYGHRKTKVQEPVDSTS